MKKLIIDHMTFGFNVHGPAFFKNVTINFESGNIYFVQGKNGVGKSTFFSILQGTTPHTATLEGTIHYDNHTVRITNNMIPHALSSLVKTVVQDVTQMIVTTFTVQENMQLALLPTYPTLASLPLTTSIPHIIHTFGIELTTESYKLSGGQKQIVAIMMALQKPTQLLLLDEPTAALDEKNTAIVMQFLTKLAKELNLIIIIITHDKELLTTYNQKSNIIITKNENDTTRTIEQL